MPLTKMVDQHACRVAVSTNTDPRREPYQIWIFRRHLVNAMGVIPEIDILLMPTMSNGVAYEGLIHQLTFQP